MKTTEEARHGSGPKRWRCFEERRASLMFPASQGRRRGEEGGGGGHLRVEGLGGDSHRSRWSAARLG
jgi:hypothetical protein